jgi:polyvinyl alcohol dehydrogenase (cytochrome)
MRYLSLIVLSAILISGGPFSTAKNENLSKKFADSVLQMGKKVFFTSCYGCHRDSGNLKAPGYIILSSMTPRAILSSLENGKMKQEAAALSVAERRAVVQWLTHSVMATFSFPEKSYVSFSAAAAAPSVFDCSGWGNDRQGTGFRSYRQAGINLDNVATLKLKWAFAFPDATIVRSKPAVAGDWLIVGGQFGDVFAIQKKTGKIGWSFTASAAIRGAIAVSREGNSLTAFFADYSTNVYAVNIKTGKQLWNHRAGFDQQSANTGSVVVYDGKVFVPISSGEVASAADGTYRCCFSSGGVVALDAKTGSEIWRHRVIKGPAKLAGKKKNGIVFFGPSGAPVWCSPTVDAKRGLLYIGTGENYSYPTTRTSDAIEALDLKTGRLAWNFQSTAGDAYNAACPFFNNCPDNPGPDLDFGMAPILVKRTDGKEILVAGQKSGLVFCLNPDDGKLLWQKRIGKGGALGGVHWGMATDGKYVYASNADNALALDKRDSSVGASPGIYALDLLNGKLIWETPCHTFPSAAPLLIPGIVFAGALDGHIRAYSSRDGKILWDFNTDRTYETVDGFPGKGGALDGPAPVVSEGILYVNSGYGMFGEKSGNVLLAFEADKIH